MRPNDSLDAFEFANWFPGGILTEAACESPLTVLVFDLPPKTWPGSRRAGHFLHQQTLTRSFLCRWVEECPLWVISGHCQTPDNVRSTPESGHSAPRPECLLHEFIQTSTCSAIARASSTWTPKYLTVLSIFVWPSSNCTARKLPVRR